MARQTNTAITFNDAIYMVNNEGFSSKQSIPTSGQCMTKADIEAYLYVDTSYSDFSSYTTNRLVPYNKISSTPPPDTTAPTFPTQLYVDNYTHDTISVKWVSSDNVGVTSQVLYYREQGGSWSTSGSFSGGATGVTTNSLTPSTTYEFYVRACDAAGNCTNSNTVSQTTSAGAPVITSGAHNLRQNTYTEYQITATNNPTGYSVSGLPAGLSLNGSTGLISGSTTVSPGVYDVYIYATNAAGTGSDLVKFDVDPQLHSHILGSALSGSNACSAYTNNNGVTRYTDNANFSNSTKLWVDSGGTNSASPGYYSDGMNWRYWDGSAFVNSGMCPINP